MRPRSFEDKLKERTDEFSLVPKPGTWENIESQLPPEKSRKRGIFWLAGAMTLLIAAGFGIQYLGQENKQAHHIATNAAEAAPAPPKTPVGKDIISHTTANQKSRPLGKNTSVLPSLVEHKKSTAVTKRITHSNLNSPTSQPEVIGLKDPFVSSQSSESSNIPNAAVNTETQVTVNSVSSDSSSLIHENLAASNTTENAQAIKKPEHKDTTEVKKEIFNLKDYLGKRVSRQVMFSELVFQPILSGSFIAIDKKYRDQDTYKEQQADRKQNDKHVWTYGIGLQVGLEKKRWLLTAGVFYQKLSYQMAVQNINSSIISGYVSNKSFDYNATDSFALGNFSAPNRVAGAPKVIEGGRDYVTNTYQYLSIPLSLTYKLKYKGRFNIGLSGSIMPQFLLSYQGLLYQDESGLYVKQKSAQENHIMPRNMALAGGLELSYHLAKHSNLFARPQYGFSLFPGEKASILTYNRFKAFSLGYRYYF